MRKKLNIKEMGSVAVGAGIGGVGVAFLVKQLEGKVADEKVKAIIPVALGAYLATTQKPKSLLQSVGYGMVGAAAPALAKAMNIPGIGAYNIPAKDVDDFEMALLETGGMKGAIMGEQPIMGAVMDEAEEWEEDF